MAINGVIMPDSPLPDFAGHLPVFFIQSVLQANLELQLLLFIRNVFANIVEDEKQDQANGRKRAQNLELVRQPRDLKTLFDRAKQEGQKGAHYDRQNKTAQLPDQQSPE